MSSVREITVSVTKPATEWVNGRALQKVSPQEEHGRAQRRMAAALGAWADDLLCSKDQSRSAPKAAVSYEGSRRQWALRFSRNAVMPSCASAMSALETMTSLAYL